MKLSKIKKKTKIETQKCPQTINMKQTNIKKLCNKDDKILNTRKMKPTEIKKLYNKNDKIPNTIQMKHSFTQQIHVHNMHAFVGVWLFICLYDIMKLSSLNGNCLCLCPVSVSYAYKLYSFSKLGISIPIPSNIPPLLKAFLNLICHCI